MNTSEQHRATQVFCQFVLFANHWHHPITKTSLGNPKIKHCTLCNTRVESYLQVYFMGVLWDKGNWEFQPKLNLALTLTCTCTETEGEATLPYVIPVTLKVDAIISLNVQMSTDVILIDYYCSEGHFHFTSGGRKLTKAQITTKMSLALSAMLIGNALSNMW